jgi:uncharacterized protein YndB with AHSA1/START domain
MTTELKDKDALTITLVFDVSRDLVWKAWTEPEHLKKWWGPKYFAAPVIKTDLRVGGKYLYCMRGPDGKDYWSTGVYREIVPMEQLVMTDNFADEKGNVVPASYYGMTGDWPKELLATVTFEDRGGKTRMTLRHEGIPAGMMREMTATGWSESFDKLAEHIVGDGTRIVAERGKQEIIITRVFDAPRTLVFKAYTDPGLIPQWWGPKRFITVVDKMNIKQGGLWRFVQHDQAAGEKFAFHGVYHVVREPELIIDTFEFEGMPGRVSLETITFAEVNGKTTVRSHAVFQTVEDRDSMLDEGMEEGVFEGMDRLAGLLGKLRIKRKAA